MNHSNPISKEQEQLLLEQYRNSGDLGVLGKIYQPHMEMTFAVCYKYLSDRGKAEDAVMDVFETVIKKARSHDIANFKSWLYTVAKNHCLMQLRKKKRVVDMEQVENNGQFMEFDQIVHLNGEPDRDAKEQWISGCMEKLNSEQKKSIELFYFQKKSYQEIVDETGFELKKVKSYIQNGKRNLKICIEQNYGNE